jgi:hypothetical protein
MEILMLTRLVSLGCLGLLSLTTSTACLPAFDEDLTRITAPRILAVQAVPAEVKPGATVMLEALVAAPEGASIGEPEWSLCEARKRLTELGPVEQSCLQGEDLLELGEGVAVPANLSVDVCRTFGPVRPNAVDDQPAGRAVEPDPTGGFYQPILVSLDADLTLASLRLTCGLVGIPSEASLLLNRGVRPNQNPRIDELKAGSGAMAEGDEFVIRPGASVEFTVRLPVCPERPQCGDGICSVEEDRVECAEDCNEALGCAGAEYFAHYDPVSREVGVQREQLSVTWFASIGAWSSLKTEVAGQGSKDQVSENTWLAPSKATQGKLWVVLRDNRGGVGWVEHRLVVR